MTERELAEKLQLRVREETKASVDNLCWRYRVNESEATRRLVKHALEHADETEIFADEIAEREERAEEIEA